MEKDYGKKIDVWSIGAIFAEMMKMKEDNPDHYAKWKPFFPGRSCYPLSPDKKKKDGEKRSKASDDDQLSVIISIVGPLSEEDMSFLSASKQTSYLKQFNIEEKGQSLEEVFPWEPPVALDLLWKMLWFNPFLWIGIDECLQHEYFNDVEYEDEETEPLDADHLKLSFEDCSESELWKYLEDTFEHFNKHRRKKYGLS